MCRNLRLDFCSFRNFFKLICALLTVFLIYQELFTFAIEKPTTTSKEDREIDINDIPEVICGPPVVCFNIIVAILSEHIGINPRLQTYHHLWDIIVVNDLSLSWRSGGFFHHKSQQLLANQEERQKGTNNFE